MKLRCNLNPKLTLEFAEGATVLVAADWRGEEVAFTGVNLTGEVTAAGSEVVLPSSEVMLAGGNVALADINIGKVYEVRREKKKVRVHCIF